MAEYATTVKDLKEILDSFRDTDVIIPFHSFITANTEEEIQKISKDKTIKEMVVVSKVKKNQEGDNLLGCAIKINNTLVVF